jgi:hypothetical protein
MPSSGTCLKMKRNLLTLFILLSCCPQAIPAANDTNISKPPAAQTIRQPKTLPKQPVIGFRITLK